MSYTIAALYRFTPLHDLPTLRQDLLERFRALSLCGTLLLAPEGINGTLAGSDQAIAVMIDLLGDKAGLLKHEVKFSYAESKPFRRLKVRLKREIITFNQTSADPTVRVGTYVTAQDWNALLDDPEVVLIDTRNDYETMIGTFAGAHDPKIETFTEFADYVRSTFNPNEHKKVAMFCTGGIRCEKASAFMLAEGYAEVYHLKGGILKYLEEVKAEDSKWHGQCYVFDQRISVGHGLEPGALMMCYSCGYPISQQDTQHAHYEAGVACPSCYDKTSDEDKTRFRMRHAQMSQGKDQNPSPAMHGEGEGLS